MIEPPNKTARVFLAVLWPLAFVVGLVLFRFPQLMQGGFPPYSWALMLAFLVEVVMRRPIDRGAWPPLHMMWRFVGVIGGALTCQLGSTGLENGLDFSGVLSGF